MLVVAANLNDPPWWLAILGWIPVALYLVRRVLALQNEDPAPGAALVAVYSFFVFSGLGTTSLKAFFRVILQPSLENVIAFAISRSFLAATAIYFAVLFFSHRHTLQATQDELRQCRSALEKTRVDEQERSEALTAKEIGKARVRAAERRLKEYKRRVTRGRYLRKLRERANSPNGSRGSESDKV